MPTPHPTLAQIRTRVIEQLRDLMDEPTTSFADPIVDAVLDGNPRSLLQVAQLTREHIPWTPLEPQPHMQKIAAA